MTNIKINENYQVVHGSKEGKVTGETTYYHYITKEGMLYGEVIKTKDYAQHIELMEESISEVVAEELGGYTEIEGQAVLEGTMYNVWVAVSVTKNKINYSLTTMHLERDEERNQDANYANRKTWKGLTAYVARFI